MKFDIAEQTRALSHSLIDLARSRRREPDCAHYVMMATQLHQCYMQKNWVRAHALSVVVGIDLNALTHRDPYKMNTRYRDPSKLELRVARDLNRLNIAYYDTLLDSD